MRRSHPIDGVGLNSQRAAIPKSKFKGLLIAASLLLFSAPVSAQETSYTQHENLVYSEAHGIGLVMDVFVPKGDKNGRAVIDVISGAWHSDRGKIRDHARGQTFQILCRKGYTVFAIRPGSVSKFSVAEMQSNLNQGILWVKQHATEYGIDPTKLGMMGASAGGHLASLAAVTANEKTNVQAVAVFFPPTDFLNYGGRAADPIGDGQLGQLVRRLAFPDGVTNKSQEQIKQQLMQISPAHLVTSKAPPFLLIHGDADIVVPLQQSEVMVTALKAQSVPAELVVKKGGGHAWPTLHEEVQLLADWFDKRLIAN